MGKIEGKGYQVIFAEGTAKTVNNDDVIIRARKTNSLYIFETEQLVNKAAKVSSLDTCHSRFGHTCVEAIRKISQLVIKN